MSANEKVQMDYKFFLQAGRPNSTPRSLAAAADQHARDFYGDVPFRVDVDVSGRKDNYTVECHATAEVEVKGGV